MYKYKIILKSGRSYEVSVPDMLEEFGIKLLSSVMYTFTLAVPADHDMNTGVVIITSEIESILFMDGAANE